MSKQDERPAPRDVDTYRNAKHSARRAGRSTHCQGGVFAPRFNPLLNLCRAVGVSSPTPLATRRTSLKLQLRNAQCAVYCMRYEETALYQGGGHNLLLYTAVFSLPHSMLLLQVIRTDVEVASKGIAVDLT